MMTERRWAEMEGGHRYEYQRESGEGTITEGVVTKNVDGSDWEMKAGGVRPTGWAWSLADAMKRVEDTDALRVMW